MCAGTPGVDHEELQIRAAKLLRGCVEHYRASITRIVRNKVVVPMGKGEDFCKNCTRLLKVKSEDEFNEIVLHQVVNTRW
jgi:hypothetical protein